MRQNNSKVIGVAGGVGSGKSTVLDILRRKHDAVICMADELGHEVMRPGTAGFEKIREVFGEAILSSAGEIDRELLARRVYREPDQLGLLNAIVHPLVLSEIRRRISERDQSRLFILETALLFETGCDQLCDEVWGVVTEDEIRIRRLKDSRGYSREKAESIMRNQHSNDTLWTLCKRVLVNDGEQRELEAQISAAVENLLENPK